MIWHQEDGGNYHMCIAGAAGLIGWQLDEYGWEKQ